MIIDCHGHYTTAPKALEDWRTRQIAALGKPGASVRASDLHISDDELRESIAGQQLAKMRERLGPDNLLAARKLHGASHRRFPDLRGVGIDLQ